VDARCMASVEGGEPLVQTAGHAANDTCALGIARMRSLAVEM
jgi:hypothetical protein